MRSNVFITQWETRNYQVFNSNEDIQIQVVDGVKKYFLYIDPFYIEDEEQYDYINNAYFTDEYGTLNEEAKAKALRGQCPVPHVIDEKNNSIIFDSPLYSSAGSGEQVLRGIWYAAPLS